MSKQAVDNEAEIYTSKVELLFERGWPGYLVAVLNALLLAFVLWSEVAVSWIVIWLFYVVLVSGGRLLLWRVHRCRRSCLSSRAWCGLYMSGTLLAGLGWGALGYLLFTLQSPLHMVFVAFVMIGMVAGGLSMLSSIPLVYYTFIFPVMLPVGLMFFLQGDQLGASLGAMIVIFLVVLVGSTQQAYRTLDRSLRLKFENDDLVQRLRGSRDQAQAASRAKSEFLANMSHEIRTPMNGILGTLQLLEHTHLDELQQQYLSVANESADTLLKLLSDMLDLSKIEAGKLSLESIRFDLSRLCQDLMRLNRYAAEEKGLQLHLELSEQIPQLVIGDPLRLTQVLNNLLSNAIKFTEQGEVSLYVDLKHRRERQLILYFEVRDSGIGIAKSAQQSLFDDFTQVDGSTTRKYGGTGLGLAICRRLLELMKGEIGVVSEPGEGSQFWFILPLLLADSTSVSRFDERKRPSPEASRSLQGEVLLVEDVEINQMVTRKMLQALGLSVDLAVNGREALQMQQQKRYSLVLMDCLMPEMDGYEAARAIRAAEAEGCEATRVRVPVIALTANVMPDDVERCFASGMDDYLAKPVKRQQLAEKLRHWLQVSAQQRH